MVIRIAPMLRTLTPSRLLARLRRPFRAVARDERGVSAVEFALLLPLMVTLFFGGTELSQAITIYRKVGHTASVLGDLVSQVSAMNATEMSNVFDAASAIMSPYSASSAKMMVAAVSWNGTAWKVEWVQKKNGGGSGWTKGSAPPSGKTPPNSLKSTTQWVIVSEVGYTYTSAFSQVWGTTSIELSDIAYLRPRVSSSVPYS